MKKIIALILATLMLFSFAACGSNSSKATYYTECGVMETLDSVFANAVLKEQEESSYKYSVGTDGTEAKNIFQNYLIAISKTIGITVSKIEPAFSDGYAYNIKYNSENIGYVAVGPTDSEYVAEIIFSKTVADEDLMTSDNNEKEIYDETLSLINKLEEDNETISAFNIELWNSVGASEFNDYMNMLKLVNDPKEFIYDWRNYNGNYSHDMMDVFAEIYNLTKISDARNINIQEERIAPLQKAMYETNMTINEISELTNSIEIKIAALKEIYGEERILELANIIDYYAEASAFGEICLSPSGNLITYTQQTSTYKNSISALKTKAQIF